MLNALVILPNQHLATYMSTDPTLEKLAKHMVKTSGETIVDNIKGECSDEACGAKLDTYESTVPEISGKVFVAGAVCAKACFGCPFGLRQTIAASRN